jgi:CBS domain-containing protein
MPDNKDDLRVRQLMSLGIVTCPPHTSLREVAWLMYEAEVSSVVIVDKKGKMQGLISQFDLLKYYGQDLEGQQAEACMVKIPIVIGPDERVAAAAQQMLKNKIHRLIVIERKENRSGEMTERAIGVISVSDIIRRMGRFEPAL